MRTQVILVATAVLFAACNDTDSPPIPPPPPPPHSAFNSPANDQEPGSANEHDLGAPSPDSDGCLLAECTEQGGCCEHYVCADIRRKPGPTIDRVVANGKVINPGRRLPDRIVGHCRYTKPFPTLAQLKNPSSQSPPSGDSPLAKQMKAAPLCTTFDKSDSGRMCKDDAGKAIFYPKPCAELKPTEMSNQCVGSNGHVKHYPMAAGPRGG
jgi:hypothetical protein